MSSNKALTMVGRDRFELSTNGLKVRSERPENQSDATRSIYGRGSLRPNCGAGRLRFFTEAAAAILALTAMGFPSVVVAADSDKEVIQMPATNGACVVPYKLQPGVDLHVHCYTPAIIKSPAATVETGSPSVSATIVQTFRKPAGAWVVLRGAANGTARIVLFDAAKYPKAPHDIPPHSAK